MSDSHLMNNLIEIADDFHFWLDYVLCTITALSHMIQMLADCINYKDYQEYFFDLKKLMSHFTAVATSKFMICLSL